MGLRDYTGRLMYDSCATTQRVNANREIHDYLLLDHRREVGECGTGDQGVWKGFGVDSIIVDADSELRDMQLTHHGERSQMSVRTFLAAPNLARGAHLPSEESRLIQGGQVTTDARNCRTVDANAVERDFDRFDPCLLDNPVSVDNIVPQWTRGGASSRQISLTQPFQKSMQSLRAKEASQSRPVYAATSPQEARATPAPASDAAAAAASGGNGVAQRDGFTVGNRGTVPSTVRSNRRKLLKLVNV